MQQGLPARAAEGMAPTVGVAHDGAPSPVEHAAVKAILHAASLTKVKSLLVLDHTPCHASSAESFHALPISH